MANSALAALLCRSKTRGNFVDPCLSNLQDHLSQFEMIARRLLRTASDRDVVTYGPYIGRSILESGFIAVRLRFDPFRSGSLHQFARHPKYDPNDILRSRFQWMGDIFPDEPPPQDIWNPEQKPQGISRALFSAHLIDLAWVPAAEALTDYVAMSGEVIDIGFFQSETPRTALARFHGEVRQLYSFLSKGVHGEFFIFAKLSARSRDLPRKTFQCDRVYLSTWARLTFCVRLRERKRPECRAPTQAATVAAPAPIASTAREDRAQGR